MRNYRVKIAKELRNYRLVSNKNQEEFANELNISLKTFSRIENSSNKVSEKMLKEVYEKFLSIAKNTNKEEVHKNINEKLNSIAYEKELLNVKARVLELEEIKYKLDTYSEGVDRYSRAFTFIEELYEKASSIGYDECNCGQLGCIEGDEYENKTLIGKISKQDIITYQDDGYIEKAFMIRVSRDYYVCRVGCTGECYINKYDSFDDSINAIINEINDHESMCSYDLDELNTIITKLKIELN